MILSHVSCSWQSPPGGGDSLWHLFLFGFLKPVDTLFCILMICWSTYIWILFYPIVNLSGFDQPTLWLSWGEKRFFTSFFILRSEGDPEASVWTKKCVRRESEQSLVCSYLDIFHDYQGSNFTEALFEALGNFLFTISFAFSMFFFFFSVFITVNTVKKFHKRLCPR